MSNVLEFPRPRLRLGIVSFRDFLRWRIGFHYNGLCREWLSGPANNHPAAHSMETKSPAQSPAPGSISDVCP